MKVIFLAGLLLATIPVSLASVNQSDDVSLMRSSDVAYPETMEFAQTLNERGLTVENVHRSKLEGFFRGLNKAAFIRTDKGVVEVIFFDDPLGAEKVRVTEQRQGGRTIYSFQGQPQPKPGDSINAGYPIYFVAHQNYLMVTNEKDLAAALKQAFAR